MQELFAHLLLELAIKWSGAHGVQIFAIRESKLMLLGSLGHGLGLSDGELPERAIKIGEAITDGMLSAVPFEGGVLELVGASPEGISRLGQLGGIFGLALEGAAAKEEKQGSWRVSRAVEALAKSLGGSLDLAEVLTITAENAALSLGFQRAFVALFSELKTDTAITENIFTYGFPSSFEGSIGVGPDSLEALFERGQTIRFDKSADSGTALAQSLAWINPETAIIAPLMARGKALGVLYVDTCKYGSLSTEKDSGIVLALAEHASLAIDNARLYDTETRKRKAAEALRDSGASLTASLHLSSTLENVLKQAAFMFRADAAGVYELQSDGRNLVIGSAIGLSSEYVLRARAKLGTGITGLAAESRQTTLAHDLTALQIRAGSRYVRQLLASGEYPYKGILGMPLVVRGEVFGVLTLYWKDVLPLDIEDLAIAEAFAAQAGLAIENARLYEEEQRREREAALILSVGNIIDSSQEASSLGKVAKICAEAWGHTRGVFVLMQQNNITSFGAHNFSAKAESLSTLVSHLGGGPKVLSRKYCIEGSGSGFIIPVTSLQGVLGFVYTDGTDKVSSSKILSLARSIAKQISVSLARQNLISALESEEARYRQLAEGAHDIILSADKSGIINYANPAAEKVLQARTGINIFKMTDATNADILQSAWENSEIGSRFEIDIHGYHLEARLSYVGNGILIIARDLSKLKSLVNEIDRRSTELKVATSRQSELRNYLALFTHAQEEERKRISRELHDDTAQVLIASSRRLTKLSRELEGEKKAKVDDILNDLSLAIDSVRRFARNLRPSVLDDLGLLPALEWLSSQALVSTRLEVSGQEHRLSPAIELTIFRLVQEAINNIDKHSGALSAAVRVCFSSDSTQVVVSDDGQGFSLEETEAKAKAGHLGLVGLRERLNLAGGTLHISSSESGTTLSFSIPNESVIY